MGGGHLLTHIDYDKFGKQFLHLQIIALYFKNNLLFATSSYNASYLHIMHHIFIPCIISYAGTTRLKTVKVFVFLGGLLKRSSVLAF